MALISAVLVPIFPSLQLVRDVDHLPADTLVSFKFDNFEVVQHTDFYGYDVHSGFSFSKHWAFVAHLVRLHDLHQYKGQSLTDFVTQSVFVFFRKALRHLVKVYVEFVGAAVHVEVLIARQVVGCSFLFYGFTALA